MAKGSEKQDKGRALDIAVSQIEKQHGRGSIMRLGEAGPDQRLAAIPTGCLAIDLALGVGGFPKGRVVELYGPEGSGKSTLALTVMGQAQKRGGIGCYIDAEHALDPDFATVLGVDIDEMLVSQPDTAEQALDICETLVRSNAVDVIVIDSVAALVPRAEIEGEMGAVHVGLQARLMSQALRKLTAAISKSKTCVIFINQIREKIGVMFGSPETTPGGRALKFYSSMRMEVRRIASIKEGQETIGNRTRIKVVKNKCAAPFRTGEFDLLYGEGISREGSLIDLAVEHKIMTKSGAWFSYKDENLGQGRENTRTFLKKNPDVLATMDKEVRAALGLPTADKAEQAEPAQEQ